ncbi:MAG: 30S ribosomal protein S17 [Desulfurococcaceae archaeon TW002]
MVSGSAVHDIGIKFEGLEPPSKTCDDPECPWHGHLKVRGGLTVGKVIKLRAKKLAVVEKEYLVYVRKYRRYEKRRSRIHVRVPPCVSLSLGDDVLIGETRPLAKSVSWVVLGVLRKGG